MHIFTGGFLNPIDQCLFVSHLVQRRLRKSFTNIWYYQLGLLDEVEVRAIVELPPVALID